MKIMLARRAAPLLITTMLVAAPAFAQTHRQPGNDPSPRDGQRTGRHRAEGRAAHQPVRHGQAARRDDAEPG